MNTYTHTARPGENGRPTNLYPQPPDAHITSRTAPLPDRAMTDTSPGGLFANRRTARNIKAGNFCWMEMAAFEVLEKHFVAESLRTATCIYVALCRLASQQGNRPDPRAYNAEIARMVHCTVRTVQHYISQFEELGLIGKEEHRKGWLNDRNSYVLHAMQPRKSLAPSPDEDWVQRATPVDEVARVAMDAATGEDGCTLNTTKESKETKKQTNRRSAAGTKGDVICPHTRSAAARVQPPTVADPLDTEHERAAAGLRNIGVERDVAAAIAREYPAAVVDGWVERSTKPGVRDRAGWALARIRSGEAPSLREGLDVAKYTTGKYAHLFQRDAVIIEQPADTANGTDEQSPPLPSSPLPQQLQPNEATISQPMQSWGPTEAFSGQQSAVEQTAVNTLPPPSATQQAIWHATKEELLLDVSGSAKLWLQHMRLVEVDADRLILSSPPVGGVANAGLYAERIATLLGTMMGRAVQVEFQSGW